MEKKTFAIMQEISGVEIRNLRKKLSLSQSAFGRLANVSVQTIARWESSKEKISGPIVTLAKLLGEYPEIAVKFLIPEQKLPLRLWYMRNADVCTIIDADERHRKVEIYNYTTEKMNRAFGVREYPTYEDYEEFLESRCFPRTRDKMKLELKRLDLPFYDPLMIIEKTEGRMAEDDFWIKIEKKPGNQVFHG